MAATVSLQDLIFLKDLLTSEFASVFWDSRMSRKCIPISAQLILPDSLFESNGTILYVFQLDSSLIRISGQRFRQIYGRCGCTLYWLVSSTDPLLHISSD